VALFYEPLDSSRWNHQRNAESRQKRAQVVPGSTRLAPGAWRLAAETDTWTGQEKHNSQTSKNLSAPHVSSSFEPKLDSSTRLPTPPVRRSALCTASGEGYD
jgi:hypothetical protein